MIEYLNNKPIEVWDKVMSNKGHLYFVNNVNPIRLISQEAELFQGINGRKVTKKDIIEVSEEDFKANYIIYEERY